MDGRNVGAGYNGAAGIPYRALDFADAGLRERCFGIFEGHTYAEVESVSGFIGNFDVKIRLKARSRSTEPARRARRAWKVTWREAAAAGGSPL